MVAKTTTAIMEWIRKFNLIKAFIYIDSSIKFAD